MRAPQLVIYARDGDIAELLRGTAGTWKWTLRELRQTEAIVRALRASGPAILVLELSRDLESDLALLERVTRLCPETAVVVVSTTASDALAGMAWDLGATYVLTPPQPHEALLPIVLRLMESARPDTAEAAPHE
jgi:DNA-binding NtrC family response regulator